jgi:hypothetical protein
MHERNNSAGMSMLISRSAANETFREALRMFVGRGKRYSVKQASNGTGIKDRMIEAFMAPVDNAEFRKPDLEETLSLASFLGPDFTTELLSPAGQGAFWLPDADGLPPGALAADSAEDTARLARHAADGKFDAPEKPDLKVIGRRMMIRGATLQEMAA